MSDDLWNPANEEGPAFSGTHADGSVTVTVQIRVQIPDDLALRARHLVDVEGLQPDLGTEVAALNEVTEVLKRIDWSENLIVPIWVQLRAGASGTGLRGDSFNP